MEEDEMFSVEGGGADAVLQLFQMFQDDEPRIDHRYGVDMFQDDGNVVEDEMSPLEFDEDLLVAAVEMFQDDGNRIDHEYAHKNRQAAHADFYNDFGDLFDEELDNNEDPSA